MYRDPGFGSDKLEVYVNTTNASAGGTLLGTINRKMTATPSETSEGWYNYTFTIPSTYNTASNYIILKPFQVLDLISIWMIFLFKEMWLQVRVV